MLGIKGAFVVIGAKAPTPHLLSDVAYSMYVARIDVVGFSKACKYTFGVDTEHAIPCTPEAMEELALGYVGPHQDAVRQMCALIALRKPIGHGREGGDGGLKVESSSPSPIVPPSGVTNQLSMEGVNT